MPATSMASSAPLPAAFSMSGTMMKTEEAGVVADRVRKRIPGMPSERGRGRGAGSEGCILRG
jgi:hypothetical protein